MSAVGTFLRALGRAVVRGLATEHGWCWAACTLGTFPIETALAGHAAGRPGPRDHTEDGR